MAQRTRAELIAALERSALFGELTRKQLNAVAKACFEQHFEPGDVIIKENDYGQRMVAVLAGTARVMSRGRRIATVKTGEAVGEMSLIDGHPTSASVVAETAVDAIELYRTAFQKLLDDVPAIARKLLLAQTARVRELDRRAAALG
jgi:CRP/FNR family cyclic AMP-dependent transcriptional regulator